jgi:chromosome segregation ATPase
MLIVLGFLLAALLMVIILPAYRRRIERFATDAVKRALPLTIDEIRADKDRMRAEYAINIHKLEMKIEDAQLSAARQNVEINRRDARVHDLELALDAQKRTVEEHENARRVLEQAILDRLPKVEQRLADSRRLLAQRDADIALLSDTSAKQTSALEEATQINMQQAEDLHRLRAALDTRAARNRETVGDPRFDGEVALRTEIEMLRAKTRDQTALLARLQASKTANDPDGTLIPSELERLRADLAKAEAQLLSLKSSEGEAEASRINLEKRVRELDNTARDQAAEVSKLKAALAEYQKGDASDGEPPAPSYFSAKADISALQAEVEEQHRTIQSLRAEVASSNERLARQAQHFRDELRRLGSGGSVGGTSPRRSEKAAPRLSLAERIVAPRNPATKAVSAEANENSIELKKGEGSGAPRLKAVIKSSDDGTADSDGDESLTIAEQEPDRDYGSLDVSPRPSRLLERISGIDKT